MNLKEKQDYYKEIDYYYEFSEVAYREGWDLTYSRSLHNGYYDAKVNSFRQSLTRLIEVCAEAAEIKKGDYVLDAGCGIGGSSFYINQSIGAKVAGINITRRQLELANEYKKKKQLEEVDFYHMDFLNTDFDSNTFDVVWAIESVCHAYDKAIFLREAYRILKPGGRLMVADAFNAKPVFTENEAELMQKWTHNLAVNELEYIGSFEKHLNEAGFQEITNRDVSENIKKSVNRIHFLGKASALYTTFLKTLGVKRKNQAKINNSIAAVHLKPTFSQKLWTYHIITAQK